MNAHPTPEQRDERVAVPEGTDPEEFLARLLAVDPDDVDNGETLIEPSDEEKGRRPRR